jgi:hypothetical protein
MSNGRAGLSDGRKSKSEAEDRKQKPMLMSKFDAQRALDSVNQN